MPNPISWLRSHFHLPGRSRVQKQTGYDMPLQSSFPVSDYGHPVKSIVQAVGQSFKQELIPIPYRMLLQLMLYSDVLRTIIRVLSQETFRNGFFFKPKFGSKCTVCGNEYEEKLERCPECGGLMRLPDKEETKLLKRWIEQPVNDFGEYLIDVLKAVEQDIDTFDNGYVLLDKQYIYADDGQILGAEVKGVYRADPIGLKLIYSKYGMGRDDAGRYAYVCPEHRKQIYWKDKPGRYKCPACGREMIPAHFAYVGGGPASMTYYAKGEIIHLKKYTPGIGYGFSPIQTVWVKVMVLYYMDVFMLKSYSFQRSPQQLLIIRGRMEQVQRAWEWLMQKARENPYMVYPLVVETGLDQATARRVAELVNLSINPREFGWQAVRDEFRRQIGAVFGVMPIYQGETRSGRGVANEGLQITITNRAMDMAQQVWNEKFFPWFCDQLGVQDYLIQLKPHEEKDLAAQLDRIKMRIEIAQAMKRLGYDIEMIEGPDGIDFRFKKLESESEKKSDTGPGRPPRLIIFPHEHAHRMHLTGIYPSKYIQRFHGEPQLPKGEAESKLQTAMTEIRKTGAVEIGKLRIYYLPFLTCESDESCPKWQGILSISNGNGLTKHILLDGRDEFDIADKAAERVFYELSRTAGFESATFIASDGHEWLFELTKSGSKTYIVLRRDLPHLWSIFTTVPIRLPIESEAEITKTTELRKEGVADSYSAELQSTPAESKSEPTAESESRGGDAT